MSIITRNQITIINIDDGEQGPQGPAGADGQSLYTWTVYADTITGSGISTSPAGKAFIGHAYNKTTPTPDVTNPSLYTWAAFFMNLVATDLLITENGQIRAGYDVNGNPISGADNGFYFSSQGLLKALNAQLIGTLRTGPDAPQDARVGIKDQAGITSGPTFSGSGDNDLQIISAGTVAGNFEVEITYRETRYVYLGTGPNGGIIIWDKGYWDSTYDFRYIEMAPYGWYDGGDDPFIQYDDVSSYLPAGWVVPSEEVISYFKNAVDGSVGSLVDGHYFSSKTSISGRTVYNPHEDHYDYLPEYQYAYLRPTRGIYGSCDLFKWRETSGSWSPNVSIIPNSFPYSLSGYDISISLNISGNHVVGDKWTFTQGSMKGLLVKKSDGSTYLEIYNGLLNFTGTISATDLNLSGVLKVANGYTKLSSGLILQWGNGDSNNTTNGLYNTFPLEFPNYCLNVVCADRSTANRWANQSINNITKAGFCAKQTDGEENYYIAIGY